MQIKHMLHVPDVSNGGYISANLSGYGDFHV